jgi:hypothetical protein
MSTPQDSAAKSAANPSSREIAGAGNPFADLLSTADLGIRIKGLITAKDAPRELSGTSKGGKPYSFFNQSVTVLAGKETVNVTIRKEKEADLPPMNLFTVRTFNVVGGRVYNGVLTYDVEVG